MKTDVALTSKRAWTDLEVEVLKRIIKHAKREGKTVKEGMEQAAYRLERTPGAVHQYWYTYIPQDYKDYVKNMSPENPKGTLPPSALEEAFAKAREGYVVEDLPFDDVGDYIDDDEYQPDKSHPGYIPVYMNTSADLGTPPDTRYNMPKAPPKASEADVEQVIASNEIYRQVRAAMFEAQHRQVAYGLDKYPEPLNASTWTQIETIDHIISETVDKLHYLTMLKIKLQHETEE